MGELHRQIAVVGEQEEAFAFLVEPANVKKAGPVFREQIKNRPPVVFVTRRAEAAARFEQEHGEVTLRRHGGAIDFYEIPRTHLRRKIGADFAVHDHASFEDECFTAAS